MKLQLKRVRGGLKDWWREEYKSRKLKNFPLDSLQTIRSEPDLEKGIEDIWLKSQVGGLEG